MLAFAKLPLLAASTLTLVALPTAGQNNWTVDNNHSRVGFSVRHFFTPVKGEFSDYTVNLTWDRANPAGTKISTVIQVPSVSTGNEKRDGHIRTPDFFDAAAHPTISFTSKGITKQVEMPVRLLGIQDIPEGMQAMLGGAKQVASFEAELTIDRREFQVGTGSWGETAVVGADVNITIQVEASTK
jgi:polyisoprenoid-binding protein YceI